MKKSLLTLTRRSFIKKSSAGLFGTALAGAGASSLYGNVMKKTNKLALLGGTPVRAKKFPSTWPIFDKNEEKALLKALRNRNWCCLRGMDDIIEAFVKVAKNIDKLT